MREMNLMRKREGKFEILEFFFFNLTWWYSWQLIYVKNNFFIIPFDTLAFSIQWIW